MRVTAQIAAFALFAACIFAADQKDTYHPDWNSRTYVKTPFPDVWRPETVAPTQRDLAAYQKFEFTIHIKDLVARFGIPDRYLVRTRPRPGYFDRLIYDLPDGYSVGFFVGKPPAETFAAGVIIDSKGKLLRLIK